MADDRKNTLTWLLKLRMVLSDAHDNLSFLYDEETDPRLVQNRFLLKAEAEARLNTLIRTITEFKNKYITVSPPTDDQIAETQRLATALEMENLKELKLAAGLKLFSDVAKLMQGSVKKT